MEAVMTVGVDTLDTRVLLEEITQVTSIPANILPSPPPSQQNQSETESPLHLSRITTG